MNLQASNPEPRALQDGRSEPLVHPLDGKVHDGHGIFSLSPSFANAEDLEYQVNLCLNSMKKSFPSDTLSEQMVPLVNNSESEPDPGTLHRIASLIYEKAKDDPDQSQVYAKLCRQLMERIDLTEEFKDEDGKSTTRGQLFRKSLLERCQEGFEGLLRTTGDHTSVPDHVFKAHGRGERRFNSLNPALGVSGEDKPSPLVAVTIFLCGMYEERLISDGVIYECIKGLLEDVRKIRPDQATGRMEALCALFKSAGPSLMSTNHSTETVWARIQSYLVRMADAASDSKIPYATKTNLTSTVDRIMALRAPQNQFEFTYVPGYSSHIGANQRPLVQGLVPVTPSKAVTTDGLQPTEEMIKTIALDLAEKIHEDAKEFFLLKALKDDYFTAVPKAERNRVVEAFTTQALEMREADAWLLAALFSHASSEALCSPDAFEKGFSDIAVWVFSVEHKNAPGNFALVVKGAKLNEKQRIGTASKANQRSRMIQLLQ